MTFILVALLNIVIWGIYGIVAGMFTGTETFLKWIAAVMVLFYVYCFFVALGNLDWTILFGAPGFYIGIQYGAELLKKNKSSDE